METQLLEFFPPNKRNEENFGRHFAAEGLEAIVDLQRKRQANVIKDELISHLSEMIKNNSPTADVSGPTLFSSSSFMMQLS
jgi:bifunctional pyridoxal-dependent enzyme with beta-cystathionase and maltose regulon repressor activities